MCRQPARHLFDTSLDNVIVIIPVRNEEVTIATTIGDLQKFGLHQIRIVDNGSSDRSAQVAQEAGAEVLYEPIAGYGRACWRGLQDIPPDVEWILFCDGDGSDDLSCLPDFFDLRSQYDLILGDRRATGAGKAVMTPVQHFGNGLASWLINLGWGHKYRDLGPLRLIRKSALDKIAMQDRGFGWTVEMQVRAIEEDLKVCEIPVNYRPRQGGKSKISGTISGSFKAGTIILSTLGKLYFSRFSKSSCPPVSPSPRLLIWMSAFLLILGAIIALPYGDFRQAENVINFGYGMGVMCLGFVVSWRLKSINFWWFWLIAIATRLVLLFMYPGSDIWRYLWEGYIQNQGFSPYEYAPNAVELDVLNTSWRSLINHPSVSAIYPPITQLGFRGLAAISPHVLLFKTSFVVADLSTCCLLTKRFSYLEASFYAWNPLVIYSFAGGGHYDSWFILPLVAAWIYFDSNKLNNQSLLISSLLIGITIAVKWISFPILGFLSWLAFLRKNFITATIIFIVGIIPLCLSALFFCNSDSCSLIPTSSTFVSHGRSAEFFPHLLAKVWHPSVKSNNIFAIPLGIATLFLLLKLKSIQQFIFNFFAVLLIISPIIHAWYFTWIIPFAVGTKNWGVRLVSVSAFIYFLLPYRQALGNQDWNLTDTETWWLWLPFIFGFAWICWQSDRK